jgi:hypothetical protein
VSAVGNYLRPKAWIAEKLDVTEEVIDRLILAGEIPAPIATRNADGASLFDGLAVHKAVQRIKRRQQLVGWLV